MGKKIQCIGRYVMDGITLGKGNFARVELATHSVTACKVAIKIIDTRKIKEEYVRQNLHREARILGQLRHPNVIRLYETLKATTLYCLVLECASGGNLLAYIKTFKDYLLPEDKGRPFVRQLVSAIHYLHERGVAHRDLKMENIMLDEKKKNIKIVDFGLSNTFSPDELMKTHCGSPEYAAPELFSSTDKYGPEVDIWSIGIILYAMVVGKLPFTTPYTDQYRRQKLLQQMKKGLSEHDREMAHLTVDCKDLLRKLIEPCPDLRLPAQEIERHAWITNNEKLPFFPFHAFPRDKPMKTQVMEELSEMLSMNKEQVEKTVHECKCDDLSAMFNMMMDNKRGDKGVFDLDYTSRQEKKLDIKVHKHRRKTNHSKVESKISKEKTGHITTTVATLDEPSPKPEQSGENEHKVSASFDFMALCSAPTWLGHEKKRISRHRRSSHYPPLASPNPGSDASNDALCVPHDPNNPNLLSPNLAAQVPFQRRSFRRSSSHRKKRSSSTGPPNRRTASLKSSRGSSSSQPNSPTTMLSPSIRIDPPRPPPIPRPKELGVTECYHLSPIMLHVPDSKSSSFTNVNGSVPTRAASNHVEKSMNNNSDSSNPCSATELLSCEGSLDTLSNSRDFLKHDWTDAGHGSENVVAKTSKGQGKSGLTVPGQSSMDTVEARIASMDIKSIVRPKQYSSMQNRKNTDVKLVSEPKTSVSVMATVTATRGCTSGHHDIVCVNFTDSEHNVTNSSSGSLDNVPISMQSSDYKNLNFHARGRCAQCVERSVSESSNEARGVVTSDVHLSDIDGSGDLADSTTELLGATSSSNVTSVAMATRVKPDMADSIKVCSLAAGCSEEICHRKQNEICTSSNSNVNVSLPKNGPPSSLKSPNIVGSKSKELLNAIEYSPDVEAYLEDGRDTISSASTRCSSTSLYKLVMPSTPTRQMFRTPLARIESFHSDDFDALASADMDFTVKSPSLATTPSSSVNTPTLPCFAYKLHLHKKKNAKLKANKLNKTSSTSNGGKDSSCVNDSDNGGRCKVAVSDSELRLGPSCSEPLISSGSDAGTDRGTDDANDKPSSVSKAKIHPMDKEEQETGELIIRGTKLNSKSIPKNTSSSNAETTGNDIKARKQQNSVEKTSKPNNSESKKVSIKCSPWKHGFVHFLRKKRQGQGYRAGSHNNNDSINSNYHSSSNATTANTRNGHTRTSYSKPLLTSQDDNSGEMETQFTSSPIPTFSDALEVRSSPAPGHSPTPTTAKVFDFTVITSESPQAKSCLLSWKGCRECTFSDDQLSEDGGSDCAFRFEQSVDVAIKTTMAIKSVQDAKNYAAYKYAHT